MKERKETISPMQANLLSLVILAVSAVVGGTYFFYVTRLLGFEPLNSLAGSDEKVSLWTPLLFVLIYFVVLIVGAAVHELVHGITWAHYCKNGWRSISFGVLWKYLMPYCHCSEPLLVSHYRIGALMPLYVVGILPLIVSPFVNSIFLCFFGVLFITGAAGDLMVVWRLRKENPNNTVMDHPKEPGYFVYEEE